MACFHLGSIPWWLEQVKTLALSPNDWRCGTTHMENMWLHKVPLYYAKNRVHLCTVLHMCRLKHTNSYRCTVLVHIDLVEWDTRQHAKPSIVFFFSNAPSLVFFLLSAQRNKIKCGQSQRLCTDQVSNMTVVTNRCTEHCGWEGDKMHRSINNHSAVSSSQSEFILSIILILVHKRLVFLLPSFQFWGTEMLMIQWLAFNVLYQFQVNRAPKRRNRHWRMPRWSGQVRVPSGRLIQQVVLQESLLWGNRHRQWII